MSNRYSSQRGFTLVELTIVIVILAILSIYAASRFQGASFLFLLMPRKLKLFRLFVKFN